MEFLSAEANFAQAAQLLFGPIREALSKSANPAVIEKFALHGTTNIALVNEEGVLMVTDGRAATADLSIGTESFEKMFPLDGHSLIAIAGIAGIGIPMAKLLRAQLSFEADDNEGAYIPAETKANIIAQRVRANFSLLLSHQLVVEPIFATYDKNGSGSGGKAFKIVPDGTILPESGYASCGSGSRTASCVIKLMLSVLKKSPQEITLAQAEHLTVLSLMHAHQTDAGTGMNIYMRKITSAGISQIPEAEIAEIVSRINQGKVVP